MGPVGRRPVLRISKSILTAGRHLTPLSTLEFAKNISLLRAARTQHLITCLDLSNVFAVEASKVVRYQNVVELTVRALIILLENGSPCYVLGCVIELFGGKMLAIAGVDLGPNFDAGGPVSWPKA